MAFNRGVVPEIHSTSILGLRDRLDWPGAVSLPAPQRVSAQVPLLAQGNLPASVYLLESGLCKLVGFADDERQTILGLRSSVWLLGAAAALSGLPSSATVFTLTPCLVRRIPIPTFSNLTASNSAFGQLVHRILASESHANCLQNSVLRHEPAETRLRNLVLELAAWMMRENNAVRPLRLPLSQTDIAQLLAVTPQHLSRMVRKLHGEKAAEHGPGGWMMTLAHILGPDLSSPYEASSVGPA